MNIKKFIHPDSEGGVWGLVSAEQLWANVYALKFNRPEKRLEKDVWKNLFQKAKAASIEFGADVLWCRIRKDYEPQVFQNILSELGFQKAAGRVEYQSDVAELPDEIDSPFAWRTASELNWDEGKIAKFVGEVIKGALDVDPNEKPEDFIQDWLHHDEYTHGKDCIAIGFLNQRPCALSVVQINSETGWSRISYMGLIPESRGQGFGQWIHRHGFTMMKAQGGKLYHGGTHSENLAMQKLFEMHGCRLYCEMEEWNFHPTDAK